MCGQTTVQSSSHCTSASTATTSTSTNTNTNKSKPLPTTLHLYFSGRDLPEPDARSRSTYAVIYNAFETPLPSTKHHSKNLDINPDLTIVPSSSTLRHSSSQNTSKYNKKQQQQPISQKTNSKHNQFNTSPKRTFTNPRMGRRTKSVPFMTEAEAAVRRAEKQGHVPQTLTDDFVKKKSFISGQNTKTLLSRSNSVSTKLRAPAAAAVYATPKIPTTTVRSDGITVTRTGWKKLGITEVALKSGRDVEFANGVNVSTKGEAERQIIRAVFFDVGTDHVHRLIGIAEIPLLQIAEANGKPVIAPLRFMAVSRRDVKRRGKIRDGQLLVAAQARFKDPRMYRFDVECGKVLRAKALNTVNVKRVYYTIHAILTNDKQSDEWTLICRTMPVEMINRKKHGGSLEYNYFSSRRLMAEPGLIVSDENDQRSKLSGGGILQTMGAVFGYTPRERFFSLPGVDIPSVDDETRLKLSLWEDGGPKGVCEVMAETKFTMTELKKRCVGGATPLKLHGNVVGKIALKYVEYCADPDYFCLSLTMQNVR